MRGRKKKDTHTTISKNRTELKKHKRLNTAMEAFDQLLVMVAFGLAYAIVRAIWMIILLILGGVDRLIDLLLTS